MPHQTNTCYDDPNRKPREKALESSQAIEDYPLWRFLLRYTRHVPTENKSHGFLTTTILERTRQGGRPCWCLSPRSASMRRNIGGKGDDGQHKPEKAHNPSQELLALSVRQKVFPPSFSSSFHKNRPSPGNPKDHLLLQSERRQLRETGLILFCSSATGRDCKYPVSLPSDSSAWYRSSKPP